MLAAAFVVVHVVYESHAAGVDVQQCIYCRGVRRAGQKTGDGREDHPHTPRTYIRVDIPWQFTEISPQLGRVASVLCVTTLLYCRYHPSGRYRMF